MKKILLKLCSNNYYTYRTLYKLKIFKINFSYFKKEKDSSYDEPVYYEKNIIKSFVLYYYYTKLTLVELNILNKLYLKFLIFSTIK